MTTILKKITGTENLIVNIVATVGLSVVAFLVTAFVSLAIINGIKPF